MATTAADRSYVHLCMRDYRDQTYTMHHIDVAPFFSRPDPDAEAMEDLPLPPAAARFDQPRSGGGDFHLLGDMVVSTSSHPQRRTLIYDVGKRAVRAGPTMRATKHNPLSTAVGGDRLYVLDYVPMSGRCFEVLWYDKVWEDWRWRALPQPPYVDAPGYTRSCVMAHTVAGAGAGAGPRIWTYTEGVGTYSFHTKRRSWRKEGDWALPFVEKAEHVPLRGFTDGLSFGFSSRNGPLCAVDLGSATTEAPPKVRGVWEDFRPPEEWSRSTSSLVHLGSGKLCVFRFFDTDQWRSRGLVAVVTGIEVGPGDDGGEIKIVRHRSRCIKLEKHNSGINWVL